MKAKYVDLPLEALPCPVEEPSYWECQRGRTVIIDPRPLHYDDCPCSGPEFRVLNDPRPSETGWITCIHLIELDESLADAEVEQAYKELMLTAKAHEG